MSREAAFRSERPRTGERRARPFRVWAFVPRSVLILFLGLVLTAGWGCAGDVSAPAFATVVDTANGIPRVMNRGEPPLWSLEEVLSLGGGDPSNEAELFGRIGDVRADASGRIYVADALRGRVDVFSASGEHLRTIGRRGEGPGEYGSASLIGLLGDMLAVYDSRNARIVLFDLDGEPIGQRDQPPINGRIVQTGPREFSALGFRRLRSGIEQTWVRHLSGGPSDTVAALPDPDRDMIEPRNSMDCPGPGGVIYIFPARYDPEVVRTPAPGGRIVETDPVGYRLVFTDLDDDTLRVIQYETPDVIVTDALWESERVRLDSMRAEASGADRPRRIERPERRPLVGSLLFDDEGRIWVDRLESDRLDIFDGSGRLIGQLRDPEHPSAELRFVRAGIAYYVTADSLDVESVRAFRIGEGSR